MNDAHDEFNKKLAEEEDKYDVGRTEHLILFQKGDSVLSTLLTSIKNVVEFYKTGINERTIHNFLRAYVVNDDFNKMCLTLVKQT